MRRADPGTLPASKGIGRMLASRRTVSVRRDPATRLARISRSVIGNCRAKDVPIRLGTRLKRPRRLVARSLTIRKPRISLTLVVLDPLSETLQLTWVPPRLSSTRISPFRLSKQACRAEFVSSSLTANPNRQQRSNFQQQIIGCEHKPDVHAFQPGSADCKAELPQILRCIDHLLAIRHG